MDKMGKFIDSSLCSNEFIQLYAQIKEKHSVLDRFNTPAELIEFLHDFKEKHYAENDQIFVILINEYQSHNKNHLLYNYLFKILTPGLIGVFYRFRKRIEQDIAVDDLDLWNQIRLFFFEVLNTYDTQQKPTKIAMTIMSRLRSRLVFWHSKLRREQQGVYDYKRVEQDEHLFASKTNSLDVLKEKLDILVWENVITESELCLILENKVFGKSLKEISQEQGISYQTLKKKLQRAMKKILKHMSP